MYREEVSKLQCIIPIHQPILISSLPLEIIGMVKLVPSVKQGISSILALVVKTPFTVITGLLVSKFKRLRLPVSLLIATQTNLSVESILIPIFVYSWWLFRIFADVCCMSKLSKPLTRKTCRQCC